MRKLENSPIEGYSKGQTVPKKWTKFIPKCQQTSLKYSLKADTSNLRTPFSIPDGVR